MSSRFGRDFIGGDTRRPDSTVISLVEILSCFDDVLNGVRADGVVNRLTGGNNKLGSRLCFVIGRKQDGVLCNTPVRRPLARSSIRGMGV